MSISDTYVGPDRCDCGHELASHDVEDGHCHFLASGKTSPARRCACKAPTTTGVLRNETYRPQRGGRR